MRKIFQIRCATPSRCTIDFRFYTGYYSFIWYHNTRGCDEKSFSSSVTKVHPNAHISRWRILAVEVAGECSSQAESVSRLGNRAMLKLDSTLEGVAELTWVRGRQTEVSWHFLRLPPAVWNFQFCLLRRKEVIIFRTVLVLNSEYTGLPHVVLKGGFNIGDW